MHMERGFLFELARLRERRIILLCRYGSRLILFVVPLHGRLLTEIYRVDRLNKVQCEKLVFRVDWRPRYVKI